MPGYRPRRDPLLRLASSVGRRAAVGTGSVGVSGVRGRADMAGSSGGANTISGELHKIDPWSVTSTSTATFTTSHPPIVDSWNLMLNGLRVHEDEFSVSGKTVTITNPSDLFKGVTTQGSPWKLEMQYDYLIDVVSGEPLQSQSTGEVGSSSFDIIFDTPTQVGSSVILFYRPKFGGAVGSVTGLGATWTQIATFGADEVWLGTGTGAGTTVSLVSDNVFGVSMVEIDGALTASGVQVDGGTSSHHEGVTASGDGLAFVAYFGGAGITLTPTESLWETVEAVGTQDLTVYVRLVTSGTAVAVDTNGITPMTEGVAGVIHYA